MNTLTNEQLIELDIAYRDAVNTPRGSTLRKGRHIMLVAVMNMMGLPVHSYGAALTLARRLLGLDWVADEIYEEMQDVQMDKEQTTAQSRL